MQHELRLGPRRMIRQVHRWLLAAGLTVLVSVSGLGSQASSAPILASVSRDRQAALQSLIARAQQQGPVRVIISLNMTFVPEARLSGKPSRTQQRQRISAAQDRLLSLLPPEARARARKMATIPVVALELDATELSAVGTSSEVAAIQADVPVPPTLPESVPLIGGTAAWAAGFSGSGQAVAILDTGADSTHPFLAGKVIAEACFSTSGASSTSLCPNGQPTQYGAGAGINCTGISSCEHGTHVAGIAAGRNGTVNSTTFSGVAKDATLIAIQVFSRFDSSTYCGGTVPCILSWTSDQIAGMDWLSTQASSISIASANLSLGGGTYSSQVACDADNSQEKIAIDALRAAGIATVIAAGNDGSTSSISAPACISSAISVGSTTKSDVVSSFSNVAPFLSVFAPGSSILSSVPGGTYQSWNGTSNTRYRTRSALAVTTSAWQCSVGAMELPLHKSRHPLALGHVPDHNSHCGPWRPSGVKPSPGVFHVTQRFVVSWAHRSCAFRLRR